MAKIYEDFDEEGGNGFFDQILTIVSNHKRTFAITSVVAAVVLLGVVVFGSYPENEDVAQTESVPIVRAVAGDYKTTPENPGGMEIPYRDSTVFGAAGTEGPENILADDTTEEPMPRSQLFSGLNTDGDQPGGAPVTAAQAPLTEIEEAQKFAKAEPVQAPSNDELVKEAIGVPSTEVKVIEEAPVETAAATIPEAAKSAVKSEPAPEAKEIAKTEPASGTTSAKAVSGGGYYVQLASVKDTTGAAGEFKKLQAKYSGLSGLQYRTQEANLGVKGTFYRIQAGPMSKDEATRICMDIKSSGGSCLVAAK